MIKKTKLSKNLLLSTASVLAMLTGGSNMALGGAANELKVSVSLQESIDGDNGQLSKASDDAIWVQQDGKIGMLTNNPESVVFLPLNSLSLDVEVGNLGTLNLIGHDDKTVYVTFDNQFTNIINDISDDATELFNKSAFNKITGIMGNNPNARVNFDINEATMTFGVDADSDLSGLKDITFSGANGTAQFNTDLKNFAADGKTPIGSVTVNDGATDIKLKSVAKSNQVFQDLTIGQEAAGNGADIYIDSGVQFYNTIKVGDNSTVKFGNNYELGPELIENTASSNIEFAGHASIYTNLGDVNKFKQISFAENSTVTLFDANDPDNGILYEDSTIAAQNIIANNVTFALRNDVKISGNLNADNIKVDLGGNQLTLTNIGNYAPTGNIVLNMSVYAQDDYGNIVVDGIEGPSNLDLSNANTTINVTNEDPNSAGTSYPGVLSTSNGGTLKVGNIQVTDANLDSKLTWTYNADGSITAEAPAPEPQPDNKPKEQKQVSQFVQQNTTVTGVVADTAPTSTDISEAGATTATPSSPTVASVVKDISQHAATTRSILNTAATNSTTIGARVSTLIQPPTAGENEENNTTQVSQGTGIAAGDDAQSKYGAWVNGFAGIGRQQADKGNSGNKSRTTGGTVGFDGLVNDNLTLGVSAAMLETKLRYKASGDRTTAKSAVFSLYGAYDLKNNWFTQAMASFGNNKVTIKDNGTDGIIRSSKYTAKSYTGEVGVGYNYKAGQNTVITPTVGLRYTKFNDPAYTRYDDTGDKSITKANIDRFEAITGARISTTATVNCLTLTPEAHANINWELSNKEPRVDARIAGIDEPLQTMTQSSDKILANLGAGITAKHKMMELSLTYDAQLSDKFVGHQGTVKLRINL